MLEAEERVACSLAKHGEASRADRLGISAGSSALGSTSQTPGHAQGGVRSLSRRRASESQMIAQALPALAALSTNSTFCLTNTTITRHSRRPGAQSAALDQAAHMGARTRTPGVLGSPRIQTCDARPLGTRTAEAWHAAIARSKCCPVALPRLRKAVWFATNPRAPREAAQAVFAPPAPDLQSKPFPLEIR